MRVGIITDCIERGPASVANYTRSLVDNLLDLPSTHAEFILIHHRQGHDSIYKRAKEVVVPFPGDGTPHSFPPLRLLSSLRQQFSESLNSRRLLSVIHDLGIDVIHIPDLAGAKAPPLGFDNRRVKLVLTLHGVAPLVVAPKLYYEGKVRLPRISTRLEVLKWKVISRNRFDLMITVSENEKHLISQKLSIPEDRIEAIHHGVNHERFKVFGNKSKIKQEVFDKYGIEHNFLLHISNYLPKKNVHRIIEAFAIAKKKYEIEGKLVVLGKQPNYLKALGRHLGLAQDLVFLGSITNEDLPNFYNLGTAFVFPSLHESFGLPILEAIACGCPTITSSIFSMPEVAGDAALLVDPYNVDEMAHAMYEVVTNKGLRQELTRRGLERAKQFSWKKCAEEHLKAYRMVMEE